MENGTFSAHRLAGSLARTRRVLLPARAHVSAIIKCHCDSVREFECEKIAHQSTESQLSSRSRMLSSALRHERTSRRFLGVETVQLRR